MTGRETLRPGLCRVRVVVPSQPAIVRVHVPVGPKIIRIQASDVTKAALAARDVAQAAADQAERDRVRAEMAANGALADRKASATAAAAAQSALEAILNASGPTGSFSLEIPQTTPAAVWLLRHGLGRRPSVTLIDSAGDLFVADVRYLDADTIQVTLSAPASGRALLN